MSMITEGLRLLRRRDHQQGAPNKNHPPAAVIFYFFVSLPEASFSGSLKIKNPACAGWFL
jgi:hypothetical protein